ncbi:MAG: galactosyltransferase-related protein [Candidatus Nanoarchaeia archaeon]|nr:galactosyltransferase-related protein [Candidatus Nanoarchaeia archaeon]
MNQEICQLKNQMDSLKIELLKLKESLDFLNERLPCLFIPDSNYPKEDISVVIGIRDRYDYRIENALKSLRNQDYDKNLIKILVVDYGSQIKHFLKLKRLCERYNAEYIRVRRISCWNRAHCLNIGIKKSNTKYILLSDVDIVFEKNYISEGIKELKKNPSQIIFSEVFESKEEDINEKTNILRNFDKIKARCSNRNELTKMYDYTFGLGIILTLNYFFKQINGLDENYRVWGFEDEDLIARFKMMGLKLKKLENTSYIHQWHPRYEGVKAEDKPQIEKNLAYLRNSHTIKRNLFGWGDPN